jgi:hypothetical protein
MSTKTDANEVKISVILDVDSASQIYNHNP